MATCDVLISGAGIAGTAAAYWLRELGCSVTVVERAPGLRKGGQTVDLRGAGRTVVERMGLLDQIRAMTVRQRGIAWVDESGRHRAEMPVEAFGGRGIVSADEILRGDLAAILYEAAGLGVSYLFDDSITAVEQDADTVLVSFEKAAPRRFDLVVGADGLHSVVRRCAFDTERAPFHPLGVLNAWFTIPAEIDLDDWYLMHNAPGGRVASIRPGRLSAEQMSQLTEATSKPSSICWSATSLMSAGRCPGCYEPPEAHRISTLSRWDRSGWTDGLAVEWSCSEMLGIAPVR